MTKTFVNQVIFPPKVNQLTFNQLTFRLRPIHDFKASNEFLSQWKILRSFDSKNNEEDVEYITRLKWKTYHPVIYSSAFF